MRTVGLDELRLEAIQLGHVGERPDESYRAAVRVPNDRGAVEDVGIAPIAASDAVAEEPARLLARKRARDHRVEPNVTLASAPIVAS